MDNLNNILFLATAFLALFAISEFIYRTFKVEAEYTRKFVHMGTGILSLLFPVLLNSHWEVLILCTTFSVILMASFKLSIFFAWLDEGKLIISNNKTLTVSLKVLKFE